MNGPVVDVYHRTAIKATTIARNIRVPTMKSFLFLSSVFEDDLL